MTGTSLHRWFWQTIDKVPLSGCKLVNRLLIKYWSSVLLLCGCSILLDHQSYMEWGWKEVEEALALRLLVNNGIIMHNHQENLIRLQLIHSKLWYLQKNFRMIKDQLPKDLLSKLNANLESLEIIRNSSTPVELLRFVDQQWASQGPDGSYEVKDSNSFV